MKIISRTIACAVASAAMLTSSFGVFADDSETGFRKDLTASQVAEEMGIGINLGNTMEAYNASGCEKSSYQWIPKVGSNTPSDYERYWGAPETTKEMIDGFKAAGFSTVRIPVFWGNMMENDGTWTINDDYIGRVAEIVGYCLDNDLYTVINIHHFDEFIIRRNDEEACCEIFKNLWTQIAEYFKDYPDKLIFEGFNEYLGASQFGEDGELHEQSTKSAFSSTNAINQAFVDAVRATGGNNAERVLIVSGLNTNIDKTTSSRFKMPEDTAENKLMVSVHYVDNLMYWINLIGTDDWKEYTESQCELLKKAFTDKGIPVFLGETTSTYPADRFGGKAVVKTSSECLEYILTKLTDYGFVPVLWDVSGNFYDRDACEIKNSDDAEVIKAFAPAESEEQPEDSETDVDSSDDSGDSGLSEPDSEVSESAEVSVASSDTVSTQKNATASATTSNPSTGAAVGMLFAATAAAGVIVIGKKKSGK